MKTSIVIALFLAGCAGYPTQTPSLTFEQKMELGKQPYWLVSCSSEKRCEEGASQWCQGAYIPLDKATQVSLVTWKLRFDCKTPHKFAKE